MPESQECKLMVVPDTNTSMQTRSLWYNRDFLILWSGQLMSAEIHS
jgi:hypothetical protein